MWFTRLPRSPSMPVFSLQRPTHQVSRKGLPSRSYERAIRGEKVSLSYQRSLRLYGWAALFGVCSILTATRFCQVSPTNGSARNGPHLQARNSESSPSSEIWFAFQPGTFSGKQVRFESIGASTVGSPSYFQSCSQTWPEKRYRSSKVKSVPNSESVRSLAEMRRTRRSD